MESASASDARSLKDQKKEMETLREALKENTAQMKELLSAHSKTTTVVHELSVEVKEAKWQLQEMQEDSDRGRASIQDKLKEFHSAVEDLEEQFKEAMEDFFDHVNETGREGHLLGTTSRTEEQEEFSDKGPNGSKGGLYEAYMENENEYYTQSHTGPTEDDYP